MIELTKIVNIQDKLEYLKIIKHKLRKYNTDINKEQGIQRKSIGTTLTTKNNRILQQQIINVINQDNRGNFVRNNQQYVNYMRRYSRMLLSHVFPVNSGPNGEYINLDVSIKWTCVFGFPYNTENDITLNDEYGIDEIRHDFNILANSSELIVTLITIKLALANAVNYLIAAETLVDILMQDRENGSKIPHIFNVDVESIINMITVFYNSKNDRVRRMAKVIDVIYIAYVLSREQDIEWYSLDISNNKSYMEFQELSPIILRTYITYINTEDASVVYEQLHKREDDGPETDIHRDMGSLLPDNIIPLYLISKEFEQGLHGNLTLRGFLNMSICQVVWLGKSGYYIRKEMFSVYERDNDIKVMNIKVLDVLSLKGYKDIVIWPTVCLLMSMIAITLTVLIAGLRKMPWITIDGVDPTSLTSLIIVLEGIVLALYVSVYKENWSLYDMIRGRLYVSNYYDTSVKFRKQYPTKSIIKHVYQNINIYKGIVSKYGLCLTPVECTGQLCVPLMSPDDNPQDYNLCVTKFGDRIFIIDRGLHENFYVYRQVWIEAVLTSSGTYHVLDYGTVEPKYSTIPFKTTIIGVDNKNN
jgi:hypothetical protein